MKHHRIEFFFKKKPGYCRTAAHHRVGFFRNLRPCNQLNFTIMAKGNLFLGQGRGKVGSVVFYRQDGEQITRTRNFHPRNPRSNSQQMQRAILATISQAYTAGHALFDHSFEGYSVGAHNQRRFQYLNLRLLRSAIAADLQRESYETMTGRVVGPGTTSPVGFSGMVVSEGSYAQRLFTREYEEEPGEAPSIYWQLPAPLANETRTAYAQRVGLLAGDYYTICGYRSDYDRPLFTVTAHRGEPGATQYAGEFFWIRLGVLSSFVSSSEAMTGVTFGDIFSVDAFGGRVLVSSLLQTPVTGNIDAMAIIDNYVENYEDIYGTIIRSRKDQDLRSNSELALMAPPAYNGIISLYALEAWTQGTVSVADSSLILEGGDF